jgi:hypothetical protein
MHFSVSKLDVMEWTEGCYELKAGRKGLLPK